MGKNKKIVVIYHGECPDGFSGAWAAWKKFGARAKYVGAKDRVNPPPGLAGKEVYFIDWTYPLEVMLKIAEGANRVIIIDHHETAESSVKTAQIFSYDIKHSAAILAWKYFHPKKALSRFLKYIEDYDLWKYSYKETNATNAYLNSIDFTFKTWNKLVRDFEKNSTRKPYIAKGESILKYQEKMVEGIVDNAERVEFFGHRVFAVNSPVLQDQLGNVLARLMPPFSIVWRVSRGKLRVSLRSVNNFDIVKYAQKFGGGGHKTAAGFSLAPGRKLPWKSIREK